MLLFGIQLHQKPAANRRWQVTLGPLALPLKLIVLATNCWLYRINQAAAKDPLQLHYTSYPRFETHTTKESQFCVVFVLNVSTSNSSSSSNSSSNQETVLNGCYQSAEAKRN
jgi:hypothetical protein